jgi:hypothetical protein
MISAQKTHLVTKSASSPNPMSTKSASSTSAIPQTNPIIAARYRRFRSIPHLLACLALASCATDGPDPSANRRGRVTNAVLAQVGSTVFKVALNSFTASLSARQNDRQIDLGHSIATGLWAEAPSLVSSASVHAIVDAYAGHHSPALATAAANAFSTAAAPSTREKIAVINQIADAISSAALLAGTAQNFSLPKPTPK